MVVGVCRLDLSFPRIRSFSEKQRLLYDILLTLQKNFLVSVDELETQKLWKRASLGIALVGPCREQITPKIDEIISWVHQKMDIELLHRKTEYLHYTKPPFSDTLTEDFSCFKEEE